MQRAREHGSARSIGVSNFSASDVEALLKVADMRPIVNQVQSTRSSSAPFEFRRGLLEACEGRGGALEAYSPLGTGRHLGDRQVTRMAERVGRTPAQVRIRWALQRNFIVLPKSTHRERIEQNARVFDFEFSDQDMTALDGLDRTGETDRALERPWW
jgi:diketogulonate reductase-like aldo/keto reductase